jgi:hypothetical protein
MLSLGKWIHVEYWFVIIKMHVESAENDVVLKNLATFCDVKPILGQPCINLLFKCVHALIKIAQK